MKQIRLLFVLLFVSALVLSACSSGEVALNITGNVDKEKGLTEEKIKSMDSMDVEYTNKKGDAKTYTGVPVDEVLGLAGPSADASSVVFVADDGFTAEVSLDELNACADCILSFRDQGGFSLVLPGFPTNAQVKGVVEFQVK